VAIALRTSRLLLRPWHDEDIAAFAEMSADPAVMQYLLPLSDRGLSAEAWVARARPLGRARLRAVGRRTPQ